MADSTDSSPTGDPHIAQSEQAEIDAQRAAKAARLFDIRRLIGGLFLIYGVILVVLGLGESDAVDREVRGHQREPVRRARDARPGAVLHRVGAAAPARGRPRGLRVRAGAPAAPARPPWRRRAGRRRVRGPAAGAGAPKAGICLQLPDFEPARPGDADCEAFTAEIRREMADVYLSDLPGAFVGVQYYTRERLDPALPGHNAPAPAGAPLTQMGWELNPDGLGRAIRLAAGSGLPVVITENGIATADDGMRIAYMRTHLEQVAQALRDGIDVRGFMYWSAFDNFEWNEGYRPQFGMVGIDRDDGLRRVVRPSARAYGELARTRSLHVFEEAANG